MQWKMNENSLFAILLRSPWWMSAAIALVIAGLGLALLPAHWRAMGPFLGAPFAVIAVIALSRQVRAPSAKRVAATLDAVRAMSWPEFADALDLGFRLDGCEVTRVAEAGADFEIAKEGRRTVVSAKRWKVARLGVEPLKELVAAREAREVREAACVLAGGITDNARAYAVQKRIRLIDGAELAKLLSNVPLAGRKGAAR